MRVLSRAFFWTQLMHYYQFNVADYRKDTVHLTPIEHYVYRTLIDWYYLDETPIPLETDSVLRRIRLGFDNEENLLNVLTDFFKKESDGWHHVRIDKEIVAYHANAVKNKANGMLGGRPKKTQSVTVGLPDETQVKGNQEPLTINHKPTKYIPPIPTELLSALMVIRKAKRLGAITEIAYNGMRKQADAAGLSVEQALTIAVERGWGSFNASWEWQDKPNKQNKRDQDLNWFLGNQPAIEKDITHG